MDTELQLEPQQNTPRVQGLTDAEKISGTMVNLAQGVLPLELHVQGHASESVIEWWQSDEGHHEANLVGIMGFTVKKNHMATVAARIGEIVEKPFRNGWTSVRKSLADRRGLEHWVACGEARGGGRDRWNSFQLKPECVDSVMGFARAMAPHVAVWEVPMAVAEPANASDGTPAGELPSPELGHTLSIQEDGTREDAGNNRVSQHVCAEGWFSTELNRESHEDEEVF
jgi:hypothetical protein